MPLSRSPSPNWYRGDNDSDSGFIPMRWQSLPAGYQLESSGGMASTRSPSPVMMEGTTTATSLYPPQPRDETEARESFRRGAIDKAHEISALSWPEHIQNHDVHNRTRRRATLRPRSQSTTSMLVATTETLIATTAAATTTRRPRSQSTTSERGPSPVPTDEGRSLVPRYSIHRGSSFHSLSARSTLRKRRTSSYKDLPSAATTTTVDFEVPQTTTSPQPSIVFGDNTREPLTVDQARIDNDHKSIEIVAALSSAVLGKSLLKDSTAAAAAPMPPPSEAAAAAAEVAKEIQAKKTKSDRSSGKKSSAHVGLATWETYWNRHVQLLVSLALFSYLGMMLHNVIDEIFGAACHKPDTFSWFYKWNICVSSPGTTESTGGAFFLDLPNNVIGCFLMGLLVSGDGESIAVNLPMAALPRNHFFQNWVVTHVGLRTGFCGALTTFASWNTQMVIMMIGTPRATEIGRSQWMSSLWGYLVGFYAALQSYQFGVAVAFCLSRYFNPHLAREADKIVDKKAIGVLIHRDLPDFERRFLHAIVVEPEHERDEQTPRTVDDEKLPEDGSASVTPREKLQKYGDSCYESYYDDHIHHLKAWKASTDDHRHGRASLASNLGFEQKKKNNNYVSELHEIEKNLLVDRIEPRQELLEIARDAGWEVDALRNWTSALSHEEGVRLAEHSKGNNHNNSNIGESEDGNGNSESNGDGDDQVSLAETHLEDAYFESSYSSVTEVGITLFFFLLATGGLLWLFFYFSHNIEQDSTNESSQIKTNAAANYRRTIVLSTLVAPIGTYCRWYLSRLNGSIHNEKWEWLPIGTFLANMIASVVSAVCAGILLSLDGDSHRLEIAFVTAISVGFAGSFSTVSTFATETTGLLRALPRAFWGYYYGYGTMVCGFVLGVIGYAWSVL